MRVLNFRKLGFFVVDFLKGSPIRKHLNDIKYNKDNNEKLDNIIKYTNENIPYYKNKYYMKLNDFPIITKQTIMSDYDSFINNKFDKKSLHWVSTSGSTGVPFKAPQDKDKRNRVIADLLTIHNKHGWELGEKYVFIRAWTDGYNSSNLKKKIQNFLPFDTKSFNDNSKQMLTEYLTSDKDIKVIIGYASAMNDYVNYLEKKKYSDSDFNIKVILTGSDNLSPITKEKLEKMFNCPIISRYSNEEQGPMGSTNVDNLEFNLNTSSYRFELVKMDSDEHVKPGEVGRILVTDLYNKAMPFIRYEIGDLGISFDKDMGNLKTLYSLEGRSSDVITDTKGNIVSAAMFNNTIHILFKLKQYQLIQTDSTEYTLKVVCTPNDYSEDEIKNIAKEVLGFDSNIKIIYLEKIDLEKTGKFKTVVNKIK